MSVLTVRLSTQEKEALEERAKAEGCSTGALVRRLISEKPLVTAADLVADLDAMMGEIRLTIRRPATRRKR